MSSLPGELQWFRHSRLQFPHSIRLLQLHPSANFADPLQVSLSEVSLDAVSNGYEALSYVWGSPKGTQPLVCNDETLLVTANCEAALRHLRFQNGSRSLWVDAICIDQAEDPEALAERNVQVPLMGEIYSRASQTLCWLGEGLRFTRDVMDHLEKIGDCPSKRGLAKLIDLESRCFVVPSPFLVRNLHCTDQLHGENLLKPDASCLDHIFCHSWHSRIWTIQEVAFSRNCHVLCGHSSIPWDKYSAAAKFLIYEEFIETLDVQASRSYVSIDVRNVLREYVFSPHKQESDDDDPIEIRSREIAFLSSCLTDVNQLRATNPKDKIYGLYAIYTRLGIPLPLVDYTKSVVDVYADAALAMIYWSGSLKVLRDACSLKRDPALPSWIPDWNDAEVRLYMPDNIIKYSSVVHSTDPAVLSPVAGKLHTRGRILGQVLPDIMPFPTRYQQCTLPVLSPQASYRDFKDVEFVRTVVDRIRYFRHLLQMLRETPDLCDGEEPRDALFDVATLGESHLDCDSFYTFADILTYPDTQYDMSLGLALAMDWKDDDITNPVLWSEKITSCTAIAAALLSNLVMLNGERLPSNPDILDLFKDLSSNLADQAVIMVQIRSESRARIGTTFHPVTAGDSVLFLQGAEWPVILRSVDAEWRFIGPACIMGIGGGEEWMGEEDIVHEFILL